GKGSYEVLTKSASMKESLVNVRENLWLLGANINLVGAESELVSEVGREIILREAIETVNGDYDYLIIDCPPSLGLLTLNSLAAVDEVLIPVQPHFLALQGFGQLLQTVSLVSKRINLSLKVSGILLCMYDSRATLSAEVKADIQGFLDNARDTGCPWSQAMIVPVSIRRNIKLAEAPSYGKAIIEYEPDCHGSEDYVGVADFIYSQDHPKEADDLQQDFESSAERSLQEEETIADENSQPQPEEQVDLELEEEQSPQLKHQIKEIPHNKSAQPMNVEDISKEETTL
ncbi:MAG: AAA family ATPase, partial [Sedimentisphaerales bacterium]|nr:AAA family ATPase [Sedimentisphaerales bacterium]